MRDSQKYTEQLQVVLRLLYSSWFVFRETVLTGKVAIEDFHLFVEV